MVGLNKRVGLKHKTQYLLTSDWHFGHRRMEVLCHRPTDFEYLIMAHLFSKCVTLIKDSHEIVLVNLGDVCWNTPEAKSLTRETLSILSKWCNSMELIKGNHDRSTNKQYLDLGFSSVCRSMQVVGKNNAWFSHKPLDTWIGYNIHGHLHDKLPERVFNRRILISQELLDYRPITLEEVLEIGQTPKWDGEKFVSAYALPETR